MDNYSFYYDIYKVTRIQLGVLGGEEEEVDNPGLCGNEVSLESIRENIALFYEFPERVIIENLGRGRVCIVYEADKFGNEKKEPTHLWKFYARLYKPRMLYTTDEVDALPRS